MDALLWMGTANAVLAGVLAVVAAVGGYLFRRRPALVHGLWLLVLLKLVTPPLLRPDVSWPSPDAAEESAGPIITIEDECPACRVEISAAPLDDTVEPGAPEPEPLSLPSWQTGVEVLWLTGALLFWGTAGWRLRKLYRLLRALPPAPPAVQERVEVLAQRLGLRRRVRACIIPGGAPLPPLVVAVLGPPQLLLPGPLWQRLSAAQRDALVLHELAHLRRGDHRVRWLELLVLGLYWWNPVAWWAGRRLRQAEELCCDAWVVWAAPASAAEYAAALVETVAYLSAAPPPPVGVSAASPLVDLERRLCMILAARTPRRLSRPGGLVLVLIGLALLPLVPQLARTAPPTPSEPRPADVNELIASQKSCLACHQAVKGKPAGPKADVGHTHDEIVKLLNEVNSLKVKLRQSEDRLRKALVHFEHSEKLRQLERLQQKYKVKPDLPTHPKAVPPADPRLEKVEEKLERLLREVESLRRELKKTGSAPHKPTRKEVLYINSRRIHIPFKLKAGYPRLALFMTRDRGATYSLVALKEADAGAFDLNVTGDGLYGFQVLALKEGVKEPSPADTQALLRKPAEVWIQVDTVRPVVKMTSETQNDGRVRLTWEARDDNLDASTLRLEMRQGGEGDWKPIPVLPLINAITLDQPGPNWEARLQVSDRAGNVGSDRVRMTQSPR